MQDRIEQPGKKIRVCFVSPKAYPIFNKDIQATFGGAEVDLYYLGTELAKDPDYEISFVTADYGQDETEQRENVTIIKSLKFEQNRMTGMLKIWRAMKKSNADMYMIKSISGGLFLVWAFCFFHRKLFLYRTANAGHCDGSYVKNHRLMGSLFVRTIKRAAWVFTQNERDKQNLSKILGVESTVIPNGHRIRSLNSEDRKFVLWAGRSSGYKRPDLFLELARNFKDERFVMICQKGTGDTQYNDLKKQASEIPNLDFIEHVPFVDIDSYFEQAKILVNTSDTEGFPNTFIQACKSGTAILAYRVNPDNFLDTHECGISCHGDRKEFFHSLNNLLEGQKYLSMGQNGLKYVQGKHDIEVVVQSYKDIFRDLTS